MTMTGTPTIAPTPTSGVRAPEEPRRTVPVWVAIVGFGLALVFLAGAVVLFAQRRDALASRDAARAQVANVQSTAAHMSSAFAAQQTRVADLQGTVHACRLLFLAQSYRDEFGELPPNFNEIKTVERCYGGSATPLIPWAAP